MSMWIEPLKFVQDIEILEKVLRKLDSQIHNFVWNYECQSDITAGSQAETLVVGGVVVVAVVVELLNSFKQAKSFHQIFLCDSGLSDLFWGQNECI